MAFSLWYGFGARKSRADRLSGRADIGLLRLLDLLDQLQLDVDCDRVSHQPAARLQRHVPVQIPVLAVDPGLRIEAGAVVPQGVLACPAYSTSSTTSFVMSRMVNSP